MPSPEIMHIIRKSDPKDLRQIFGEIKTGEVVRHILEAFQPPKELEQLILELAVKKINNHYSTGFDQIYNCTRELIKNLKKFQESKKQGRSYNKNPLHYFKSHPEFYSGFARVHLRFFDNSLYQALSKYNQLQLAIPEHHDTRFKPLPEEKRKQIIQLYKKYQYAAKVARELGISSDTARKYLRQEGINTSKIPNKNKINQMINLYRKLKSLKKVSQEIGFAVSTVRFNLIREGLEMQKPGHKTPKSKIEKILKDYKNTQDTTSIAKKYNVCTETVRRYARAAGLKINKWGGKRKRAS